MPKSSRRGASEAALRRVRPVRAGTDSLDRRERGRSPKADGIGFALFVGYLVLAFTLTLPDHFSLPKLLGLFVYVAFCAARWLRALQKRRIQELPRGLLLASTALACWWTATTLTAQHLPTALFGMRDRYNGLATMLAGLALFLFTATTRITAREIEQRLGAIGVALTVASAYAVVQAAGLDVIRWPPGRPPSTLGHPVIFAGALAISLPFTLTFALDGRSRTARRAWGAMALVQAVALTLTLARGPWLGAACGFVVLAALALLDRRALVSRMAGLAAGALLLIVAVLVVSSPTRTAVLARFSTLTNLADDSSFLYRLHFYRASLAMLRDHPVVGVGWENFGLLYPRYRSAPTSSIAPDLVPTMVHSGPLQTAVSGGLPALALQILFFVAFLVVVARRRRDDSDVHRRLLGAAFIASAIGYVVQDLSGWPAVPLGTLAFLIWGLGVSWSLANRPRVFSGRRWPLVLLASAAGIGSVGMSLDTWKRIRAERLMFEAQHIDVGTAWGSVERRVRAALSLSPDRAWVSDAAARLYLRRAAATGDRRAYEQGVELTRAAEKANPFDPYIRLRRADFDIVAIDRGLIPGVTDEGRDALTTAKSLTVGSAKIRKVEASLSRKAGRIAWIQPQPGAGFGPAGGLVVAGTAPRTLVGTRVYLHWRNATRGSAWTTAADAPVPDSTGRWFNAIPNANFDEAYDVYATTETWSYGPCAYTGHGSIQLCGTLALIEPAPAGAGPPDSLLVAGSVPEASTPPPLFLHWRNATRQSAWTVQPFRPDGGQNAIAFPSDVPGHWYAIIPRAMLAEQYQVHLSSPTKTYEDCTYTGEGTQSLCAPISWIQPQAVAGIGPPGSLVVAGFAPTALAAATPVFLHWRDATRGSPWTTEVFTPVPDRKGVWYNAIRNADLTHRYEVYITASTTATDKCSYTGDGLRNVCP